MSDRRKCVFGCKGVNTLFGLPKAEDQRGPWLDFIHSHDLEPQTSGKNILVCDRHFTSDCLQTCGYFNSGLSQKLILKLFPSAVPTIKPVIIKEEADIKEEPADISLEQYNHFEGASVSKSEFSPSADRPVSQSLSLCAKKPPETTLKPPLTRFKRGKKSMFTQLSPHTFRSIRSKAVQASPAIIRKGHQTKPWIETRPKKRPRLDLEEEEDEVVFKASSHGHEAHIDPEASYEDTKYIVFEKNLHELFEQCPVCACACAVQRKRRGSFVSFLQVCPGCSYSRSWQNQPLVRSTPVGDLQLAAAVFFCGGSFQKTHRICKGLNLQIPQLDTFRKHLQMYLQPAVCHNWKIHRESAFDRLREQRELPVAGDMSFHSPGPEATVGSYTTMNLKNHEILNIELVQSKDIGEKKVKGLETRGLKRSLRRLEAGGVKVDYMVTDRRSNVQKYLQKKQIPQFYDVWHLEQELSSRLDKLSEKFLIVKKWSAAIKHHMYWVAASSKSEEEKVAKWISQMNHMQDIHQHDNPLFPSCVHSERETRDPEKWFKPGSIPLLEVEKLLLNWRVLRDIPKLCSNHHAASLHAFHDVIRMFAPDSEHCSVAERKCRMFLAAMHYNENMAHEQEIETQIQLWICS
uniref:THAP-type domain-containing protein n=1 Tax=Knipowitschia caucasica TaxID=637954 RepID=A0AAV2LVB2_KNICA